MELKKLPKEESVFWSQDMPLTPFDTLEISGRYRVPIPVGDPLPPPLTGSDPRPSLHLGPLQFQPGWFPSCVSLCERQIYLPAPTSLLLNQMEDSYDSEPRVPGESVCKHQLPLRLLLHSQCWRGPDLCSEELSTLVPFGCKSDIWRSSCLGQGDYFLAWKGRVPLSIPSTCMLAMLLQSCLTLCNPMDCSPPGFSVHGILRQEYWNRLLCPTPGDLPYPGIKPNRVSYSSCIGRQVLYH